MGMVFDWGPRSYINGLPGANSLSQSLQPTSRIRLSRVGSEGHNIVWAFRNNQLEVNFFDIKSKAFFGAERC